MMLKYVMFGLVVSCCFFGTQCVAAAADRPEAGDLTANDNLQEPLAAVQAHLPMNAAENVNAAGVRAPVAMGALLHFLPDEGIDESQEDRPVSPDLRGAAYRQALAEARRAQLHQ